MCMERKLCRMTEIEYAKKCAEFARTNKWPSSEQEIRLMREITTDLAQELIGEHIETQFLFPKKELKQTTDILSGKEKSPD